MRLPIFILCGGLGTRLKSLFSNKPKILVDIDGKSFLEIQFLNYFKKGVTDFNYIVGYGSKAIEVEIKKLRRKYPKAKFSLHYEGEKRLGTGGALFKIINKLPEKFILTYGDNYLDLDFKEFTKLSSKKNVLSIYKNSGKFDRSNIYFDEKCNKILMYDKNSEENLKYIDYGMSIWMKDFLLSNKAKEEVFDFSYFIEKAIAQNKLEAYVAVNRFYEIGTPSSYNEFKKFYQENV